MDDVGVLRRGGCWDLCTMRDELRGAWSGGYGSQAEGPWLKSGSGTNVCAVKERK